VQTLEVAVIGAGIGGLTAALSLHEIAAHVEVFAAAPSLEPIGVGINLLPHAVRELDALGLLGRLIDRAVLPESLVYCTRRGQEIWREPRGRAAGYRWPPASRRAAAQRPGSAPSWRRPT
jgi:5-methylphenazine-1-carboxylate 1-monooxygenase